MRSGRLLCHSAVVALVVGYVAVQCGVRGLDPNTVKATYLPGIANYFRSRDLPDTFAKATKEPSVSDSIAGFTRLHRKQNPEADSLKLAFGMDLAVKSCEVMRSHSSVFGKADVGNLPILEWRYFTSMAMGIFFMLRKSEHIGSARSQAEPLRCRHITFFDEDENPIPHEDIGKTPAHKMALNVRFAKTDVSGFGRRTFHTRQVGREHVCVVCIAERWLAMTIARGALPTDLFYDCPGLPPYSVTTLHTIMELTVSSLGVKGYGAKATSHSLRYGGATMMAAAGFPQYLIAHYGGWAPGSKSLNRYARPSEDSIALVSQHMSSQALKDPSRVHIQDLIVRQRARIA